MLDKSNKSGLCKKHFEESDHKSEYLARRKNYKRKKVFNKWSNTDVWLLSSLEILFFEYLEKNNIEWKKPLPITYNTSDGVTHRYFPDFYLPTMEKYIELKGYFWQSDKVKMDLVKSQHPDLKIDILFTKDVDNLGVAML